MSNSGLKREKRIAKVRAQGLQKDIERLAGAPFWAQIEALHKIYGDALGITQSRAPAPASAKVLEPLRAAQRSIANYLLQVAATASHDEDFVPAAKHALAPVDLVREAAAKRTKGGAAAALPTVTAETPLPQESTVEDTADERADESGDSNGESADKSTASRANSDKTASDATRTDGTTDKRASVSAEDAAASGE